MGGGVTSDQGSIRSIDLVACNNQNVCPWTAGIHIDDLHIVYQVRPRCPHADAFCFQDLCQSQLPGVGEVTQVTGVDLPSCPVMTTLPCTNSPSFVQHSAHALAAPFSVSASSNLKYSFKNFTSGAGKPDLVQASVTAIMGTQGDSFCAFVT